VKERPAIPLGMRRKILARDSHTCRYCGVIGVPMVMEHVVPVALGGATTMRNLVTACVECNDKKGVSIWKPRQLKKKHPVDHL
jgi:5-methylcytosine-specific restriction endonuclease McrA